jgi:hypothetical protein
VRLSDQSDAGHAARAAWGARSDSATTGMLVSVDDPVNPGRLSGAELALRDQID